MEDEQIKDELVVPAFRHAIKQMLDAWNGEAKYGKFTWIAYDTPSTSQSIDLTVPDHTIKIYYESNNLKYIYTVLTLVRTIFTDDHLKYMYAQTFYRLVLHATMAIPDTNRQPFNTYNTFSPIFTVKELIEGEYEKWREN